MSISMSKILKRQWRNVAMCQCQWPSAIGEMKSSWLANVNGLQPGEINGGENGVMALVNTSICQPGNAKAVMSSINGVYG